MDDIPVPVKPQPTRLTDQFRLWLRQNNYRYKTEQTYLHWLVAYIRFHKLRHPKEMSTPEIEAFLTHLSVDRFCSVGTQKVALNALNCFYRKFLRVDFPDLSFRPAKRRPRVPVVFTDAEARAIFEQLHDPYRLMAEIMYGCGLRVSEALRWSAASRSCVAHILSATRSPLAFWRPATISARCRSCLATLMSAPHSAICMS